MALTNNNKEETKKNIIGKLYTVNTEELIEWLKSDERAAWYRRNWSDKMPDWESGEKINFYQYTDKINGLSHAYDYIEKGYIVNNLIDAIKYNETFGNAFEAVTAAFS